MSDEVKTIKRFDGRYAFLSNFYQEPSGITNEHRYQAAKAKHHPNLRDIILQSATPGQAKRLGRGVPINMKWWHKERMRAMLHGLHVKFQNPELRKMLLDTGDAVLIEGNYWHDNFWGNCYCNGCADQLGHNHLGLMLMDLRKHIKEFEDAEYSYGSGTFQDPCDEETELLWTEEEVNAILDDEERRHRGE